MKDELLFRSATQRTTAGEEKALAEWLDVSAENRQRSREVVEVLVQAAEADDKLIFGAPPTADEMLNSKGGSHGGRPARHSPRTGRTMLLAAAAVAAVVLSVPLAQRFSVPMWGGNSSSASSFGSEEFVTESEPATVGLRDGSVVRLAPETRLRVHARQEAREVSIAGRGYFAVSHNAAQPFTIRSDAGTVTVLGTRFDLTATGEDLRLIVIEGRVRLTVRGSHVDVRAGQLAQVLKGNLVAPVDVPDPESLIGWVGNFIAFQDTPLRTVAREIAQRHGVRIELASPELGDRTVTALFAGRSFEEIAEVICVVAQLQCTRVGDVVRMAPAR